MKKSLCALLSLSLIFALSACGSSPTQSAEPTALPTVLPTEEPGEARVLVAYFSATGNTEAVAAELISALGAEGYEIVPEQPYTDEDLNWRDAGSRSSAEHEDPSIRPAISGELPDTADYDVVLLGYPLWWGDAPLIVRSFLEGADFTGKTIIPFCTSSSSGFGGSGENLQPFAPQADWREGQRFSSRFDAEDVREWAQTLGLSAAI